MTMIVTTYGVLVCQACASAIGYRRSAIDHTNRTRFHREIWWFKTLYFYALPLTIESTPLGRVRLNGAPALKRTSLPRHIFSTHEDLSAPSTCSLRAARSKRIRLPSPMSSKNLSLRFVFIHEFDAHFPCLLSRGPCAALSPFPPPVHPGICQGDLEQPTYFARKLLS